jgi:predicted small secreted protein
MSKLMRSLVTALGLLAVAIAIPACNTVKGVGRDIEGAAEGTENVIQDATD